jgi:hypothetical protein
MFFSIFKGNCMLPKTKMGPKAKYKEREEW